jgi:large subunit ribosomal protein L19
MKAIEAINQKMLKNVPDLKPGDTVKVHTKIIEGTKERIQIFEGVVLRVKGGGIAQTFTVRKLSYGIGVERTFLIQSPKVAKIEIKKRANVRRAYLTYLRELRGKAAKLKDLKFDILAANTVEELKPEDLAPPTEEVTDAEITELVAEEVAEEAVISEEVSVEDIAEVENADEATTDEATETDHQASETEEVESGIEKAETDLEKGIDGEGSKAEKNVEDVA